MASNTFVTFPNNTSVQFDGTSHRPQSSSPQSRNVMTIEMTLVHPSPEKLCFSTGVSPSNSQSKAYRALPTHEMLYQNESNWSNQSKNIVLNASSPVNYANTREFQETVVEDRSDVLQDTNASEVLAEQFGVLNLGGTDSSHQMLPQKSTNTATSLSSSVSDSAFVASSGPFLATSSQIVENISDENDDRGYVSAGSGVLAAPTHDTPRIVLDITKLQEIYNQRYVSHRAVSEGRANIDLFYGVDGDGDTCVIFAILDLYREMSSALRL